ncbi:YicC family protein [Blautia sp. An249]|uniref:YicC/YloC family endoribonuclease n=1 Tax=Blautia sp. An249 TaxID=1965603 RepID=UPI000B37FED5|nr:YicC/YloC family endoribonuclease [Blautia sp. An249]OUO80326.1 YicC family protein [Blautia sp. An249]
MIKSMTGYGRAEANEQQRKITVELKSVNHRYLDANIKMPKNLSFFEAPIRNFLKEYMQRGKIDIYISYEDYTQKRVTLKYNREIAREYMGYFQKMSEEFGLENDIRVSGLSRYPEVLTMDEEPLDERELWSFLEPVLREACVKFVESREKEGVHLKEDLLSKLKGLEEKVLLIMERSPQIVREYREKLEAKTKELLGDAQIEESRIAAEVIIYADKICNDEETVRLQSHIKNMEAVLEDESSVGRKMDFIAQEMNREANTILSKANDLEISNLAIDLKTEIEKIREQIQNIE